MRLVARGAGARPPRGDPGRLRPRLRAGAAYSTAGRTLGLIRHTVPPVRRSQIADGDLGRAARDVLSGRCTAPELVDIEVGSALRRLVLAGRLSARRAGAAVHDLHDLPLRRAPHRPLLDRCWALRGSVTFYDAAYVALADLLAVPLVTTDSRLATAAGPRCAFVLLT